MFFIIIILDIFNFNRLRAGKNYHSVHHNFSNCTSPAHSCIHDLSRSLHTQFTNIVHNYFIIFNLFLLNSFGRKV